MVGALADWFAVVALFRRPLNLPIPHTAIIPRNKERIARGLSEFIQQNSFVGCARAAHRRVPPPPIRCANALRRENIDTVSTYAARFVGYA